MKEKTVSVCPSIIQSSIQNQNRNQAEPDVIDHFFYTFHLNVYFRTMDLNPLHLPSSCSAALCFTTFVVVQLLICRYLHCYVELTRWIIFIIQICLLICIFLCKFGLVVKSLFSGKCLLFIYFVMALLYEENG